MEKEILKMCQTEQYIKRPRGQREMAGWRNWKIIGVELLTKLVAQNEEEELVKTDC